jgi:hypothetical protein
MDINTLLTNIIGALVANIPALIGILTTVGISLGKIRSTTNSFPEAVSAMKKDLLALFGQTGEGLETAFLKSTAEFGSVLLSFTKEIGNTLVDFKKEIYSVLETSVKQITEGVNDALVGMKSELSTFNEILLSNRDHINFVAVESKLYIDSLISVVSKDPQLIRDGVASVLTARLNRTKEELEKFPLNLCTNPVAFESSVKEILLTVGKEKFEEMLRNAGYDAKKTL